MNWTGTHTQRVINNKHTLAHTRTRSRTHSHKVQLHRADNAKRISRQFVRCDESPHGSRDPIWDLGCGIDAGHLHCMEKAVDDGMLCCIMLSSWPKRVDDGAKQDNIGMLFVSRVAPLFGCFSQCILYAWLLLVASSVRLGSRCVRD